jgi:hypothetical protein
MRYKKKLIILFLLILLLTAIQYTLPYYPEIVTFYDRYVFRPFQTFRNVTIGLIPLSIGDILYIIGGALLLMGLARWLYFLITIRTHAHYLADSFLNGVISLATLYIIFVLGWGGNYYKPSLTTYWDLDERNGAYNSSLISYDAFLVQKLNTYAPGYEPLTFRETERRAREYYKEYTNSRTKLHGLNVKPSIFGFFMQHLGIQGYYNPFTGEAQVNSFLPAFMQPFVISHEMAHQSGIAAEDDANLLAYALGATSGDSSFNYSAYLNVWLYTHARVRAVDTHMANIFRKQLNPITKSHLDTLRAIRRKFDSDVNDYSSYLYDEYLKLHNQKEGIETYDKVSISAWAWERQRDSVTTKLLRLP